MRWCHTVFHHEQKINPISTLTTLIGNPSPAMLAIVITTTTLSHRPPLQATPHVHGNWDFCSNNALQKVFYLPESAWRCLEDRSSQEEAQAPPPVPAPASFHPWPILSKTMTLAYFHAQVMFGSHTDCENVHSNTMCGDERDEVFFMHSPPQE
jgi:hypothetical protein